MTTWTPDLEAWAPRWTGPWARQIRYNPKAKQRSLDALRWGLIPYWAKDPKITYKTINARAETVDTAPSYREAFKKRRCLIPADGFYECRTIGGHQGPVRDPG